MNQSLVKLAHESAPKLMEKTAYFLQLLERLDPPGAEMAFQEMREIIDHADGKAKTAGFTDWAKDVGAKAGTSATVGVLTGLGLSVATDLYNSARRGLTSGRNWKRMLESNPRLREDHSVAEVRKAFNMLQRHAPDVASDPLAAGAFVHNVLGVGDMPGVMHKQLSDMVKAQKEKAESRYTPFKDGPKVTLQSGGFPRTSGDGKGKKTEKGEKAED